MARGKNKNVKVGIHCVARQDWPPAIVPDHAAFIDKGYSCFADQFGRLAIVDFKKVTTPKVIGELGLQTKKLLDFVAVRQRAYALTTQDSASGDVQFVLVTISLAPATEPSILSKVILTQFADASCLTATTDYVCIGGATARGANEVAIFAARGKSTEPGLIASFAVDNPITDLDLQERNLVVLESGSSSQLDYVNLFYPQKPQLRKNMKLDGDFRVLARSKDLLVLAGQSAAGQLEAKTVTLEPAPHVMQSEALHELSSVFCAVAQKDRFYFLGEHNGERRLVEFLMGKDLRLTAEKTTELTGGKVGTGAVFAMAISNRSINVAAGWQGVDVLTLEKQDWRHTFTYSIPRFPASGVATWDNFVLLAGADLKLYDISTPEKPVLVQTTETGGTVKAIATAGVFLISLSKNTLSLRRLDSLTNQIASTEVSGQDMSFDKKQQKAYVLHAQEKKTVITPVKAYSNKLVADLPLDLPAGYRRILADDGAILLCSLKEVALYQAGKTLELVGKQTLEGYAIRDVAMTDEQIVVTAVDHSSKGYLFVLARDGKDLSQLGAIALPDDGTAVAAAGNQAVVVGRTAEGKDLASIIDLSTPAIPRIAASFPSVEASSAVTIKDRLAIVVGRGLEILSLG
jgi:hypothetical protein